MSHKERWFIIITLLVISFLTSFDLITDLKEGVTWWHVSVEGSIAIMASIGIFILIRGMLDLKHTLASERELANKLKDESSKWKEQAKKYLDGLSHSIDLQLTSWDLSKSEKEVAFLLLKGFSLKEIAELRGTTEKTARTQSAAIYSKAGLNNRSQLSAFFLEDLLLPQNE